MEGRRVDRQARGQNPLYVLFLCLLAAVFILLLVTIVLGVKLSSTRRALESAETKLEALQDAALNGGETDGIDGEGLPDAQEPDGTETDDAQNGETTDWLDLSGHSEIQVRPEKVFDSYVSYYTNAGVNLRGGPGTDYQKVQTVDKGSRVEAAAKSGDWTFVSVDNRFGWIRSDYLSLTPPASETESVN